MSMTDDRAADLFIAGVSPRLIGERLNLTRAQVNRALTKSIGNAAAARAAVAGTAPAVFAERCEMLFGAQLPLALAGDKAAAELCRRILVICSPAATGPQAVSDALAGGDATTALQALRHRLGREIDHAASPYALVALAAQYLAVTQQLNLTNEPVTPEVDEIAERRARRHAALRDSDAAHSAHT